MKFVCDKNWKDFKEYICSFSLPIPTDKGKFIFQRKKF